MEYRTRILHFLSPIKTVLSGMFEKGSKVPVAAPVSKRPLSLASNATDTFTYFPLRLKGYPGYTDHNAMNVEINDDLLERAPEQQFMLAGFGAGFLGGIYERLTDVDIPQRLTIRTVKVDRTEREYIGWLARLQKIGTDNAGESTENLRSVLNAISSKLRENGPITKKFWHKVHGEKTESIEAGGTSAKALAKLDDLYRHAFQHGERLASEAIISRTANAGGPS